MATTVRAARAADRRDIAGGDEHGVDLAQCVPGQRIVTARRHARAEHRDRPLAVALAEMGEAAALRPVAATGVHGDAAGAQRPRGGGRVDVVAQRGEELGAARQPRHRDRGDATAPADLGERLRRVDDLPRPRQPLDDREVDPLDVPDDRGPRSSHSTSVAPWRRSQRRGS
ncbi:MAG: hypothetical protein R2736_14110 [Solirubrobacterales bacterium]